MRHLPLLFLALFAGLALSFPLSDTDLWWHLAAGREMVERSGWLRQDPFCVSSLGTSWIDLHWSFQLLVLAIHRLGGEGLLVALRVVLVLLAVGSALRGRLSWETAAIACLLIQSCRESLELRPLLVSLACLALQWNLLEGPSNRRSLVAILALQVLMANAQGLFLLGPLFALAHGTGLLFEGNRSRARRSLGLALGLVVVSLVNPWGWHAFELAGLVAGRIAPLASNPFSREIAENLPLPAWIAADPSHALPLAWAILGAIALRRGGPGAWSRGLLVAGTAALSLMAVRNLPLLALAMLVSIAPAGFRRRWIPASMALVVGCLLAVPLLAERRWNLPSSWIAPTHLPDPSMVRLLASQPGPVFHELRAGGWLSWNLPGRRACWADTRLVLHDGAFLRSSLEVFDHPDRFEAFRRAEGFRFALLPASAWPRDRDLVISLLRSPEWKLLDGDGAWVLFARAEVPAASFDISRPADRDSLSRHLTERFGSNPLLARYLKSDWDRLLADAGVTP